jgi:hypothetical protein
MSDPSASFSKIRAQRSRKKCPNKEIMARDLWPNIRLHGIRLLGIKLQCIRPLNIYPNGIKTQVIVTHGARLLNINDLSRDLFLPSKMANQRLTNPSISKWSKLQWATHLDAEHDTLDKSSDEILPNPLTGRQAGSGRRKTSTPWREIDSPRWWELSCLGFGS